MASWLDLFQSAALARIQQSTDRTELSLLSLHTKVNNLMTAVQIQQEALDEYAQAVSDVADEIASDIKVLTDAVAAGQPLPQANVDSLGVSLDKLKSLDLPDPEPPA